MKKLSKKGIIFIVSCLAIVACLILVLLPKGEPQEEKKTQTKPSNEYAVVNYYKKENLTRYKEYQKNNPKLAIKDIVTHVNMNIDYPFYQKIIKQENPNELNTIVNKVYQLDHDYAPSDLININDAYSSSSDYSYKYRNHQVRKVVYDDFKKLRDACKAKGIEFYVVSGYRSTQWQEEIYNHNASVYGQEETDKTVSRPGHSEHTTGLAMDIALDQYSFQDVEKHPQYQWFLSQLSSYGFILRYPKDKKNLTGYDYEAWHIRYLGKDLAKKVSQSKLTYEEYYARHN